MRFFILAFVALASALPQRGYGGYEDRGRPSFGSYEGRPSLGGAIGGIASDVSSGVGTGVGGVIGGGVGGFLGGAVNGLLGGLTGGILRNAEIPVERK
ncbi:hypothetical protein E2P81_ATG06226 [Venturia nashicola]|uniref:Uncharacterized protein n=1 Tax=Venturia nashicola TaxID=86259 RepID=A0A4Z1P845_9PEZI|nr:hypothetical protein E6O75_ATG06370 [Venturia nashicola]TLD27880.1 hypothetical protein E2P81_ATG06226 [Venturia nashicola]